MSSITPGTAGSAPVCPVCSTEITTAPTFHRTGHDVYTCPTCSVRFVYPIPSPANLMEIYSVDYFQRGNKYSDQPGEHDYNGTEHLRRVRFIKQQRPSGRLLDVGCALGGFLNTARNAGYDVQGIELSQHAAAAARAKHDLDISATTVQAAHLPDAAFDIVTLWDVLEHLPSPLTTVTEIARILRPGGLLVFTTGNIASRWAHLLRSRWQLLTPPQHLTFHTPQSVRHLLDACGLSLTNIQHRGKRTTLGFALFKASESFGRGFRSLHTLARKTGIARVPLYLNLYDIMTCTATRTESISTQESERATQGA